MSLPSISIASIVIGFISFSFTLAILSQCKVLFAIPGSAGRPHSLSLVEESLTELGFFFNCVQYLSIRAIPDCPLCQWLQAFWDAFLTLGSAPNQIQDVLSVLRQGLYEEREYLKRTRRRGESTSHQDPHNSKLKNLYYEGGPTRAINDAVKDFVAGLIAWPRSG